MPRERFEHELMSLGEATILLGAKAATALERATQALMTQDLALAQRVVADDRKINSLEHDILADAARLLALQAPVASDLRRILGISRVASNYERIGDHARDIARGTLRLNGAAPVDGQGDLAVLIDQVKSMLREGLACYERSDAEQARAVCLRDDTIDQVYGALHRNLLAQILENPALAVRATHTLFIGHDLERISDHVTNVAETVVYIVTGESVELN